MQAGASIPGLNGRWLTSATSTSCNELCNSVGLLFDSSSSRHTGNAAGQHFYPGKSSGGNWESIECSSIENNHNWGANGGTPNGDWSRTTCHLNCACMEATSVPSTPTHPPTLPRPTPSQNWVKFCLLFCKRCNRPHAGSCQMYLDYN